MRCVQYVVLLSGMIPLASCDRGTARSSTQMEQKSLEQRLADMEQSVDGSVSRPSEDELRREAEKDFAEIKRLGLVDRANTNFKNKIPNSKLESGRISYFMDTNTVWCSFSYKVQGSDELRNQEFGYKRENGTNWALIWTEEKTMNTDRDL